MNRFITERKDNWERLEDLLSILETSPLRGLPRAEVREFGELYRRAATDLAIARAETRDPKLVNYLNSLVIRAHGKIYRAEGQGLNLIWQFFAKDFPQTFRKTLATDCACLRRFHSVRHRFVSALLLRFQFRRCRLIWEE